MRGAGRSDVLSLRRRRHRGKRVSFWIGVPAGCHAPALSVEHGVRRTALFAMIQPLTAIFAGGCPTLFHRKRRYGAGGRWVCRKSFRQSSLRFSNGQRRCVGKRLRAFDDSARIMSGRFPLFERFAVACAAWSFVESNTLVHRTVRWPEQAVRDGSTAHGDSSKRSVDSFQRSAGVRWRHAGWCAAKRSPGPGVAPEKLTAGC